MPTLAKVGRRIGGAHALPGTADGPEFPAPVALNPADIAAAYAAAHVQEREDPFAGAEASIDAEASKAIAWAKSRLPAGSTVNLTYSRCVGDSPYSGRTAEVEWAAFVGVSAGAFEPVKATGYARKPTPSGAVQSAVLEALDAADAKATAKAADGPAAPDYCPQAY